MVAGVPHHVTQRGNRREPVFFSEKDWQRYLELLGRYSAERGLGIVAYCLMTNHVHLVAVPPEAYVLGAVLKPVHPRYAQHVNWTQRLSGRLWQGRFFSCPMDDAHALAAIRHVEQNPVRAGLVARAEEYPRSSAAAHAGLRGDALVSDPTGLVEQAGIADWGAWLREQEDPQAVEQLRASTRTGRPLGSAEFIERLERLTHRHLRPKKTGRPRRRAQGDWLPRCRAGLQHAAGAAREALCTGVTVFPEAGLGGERNMGRGACPETRPWRVSWVKRPGKKPFLMWKWWPSCFPTAFLRNNWGRLMAAGVEELVFRQAPRPCGPI